MRTVIKKMSVVLALSIMTGGALLMSGCESDDDSSSGLPKNPALDGSSSRQVWSFGYKEFDHTFRIRWPSYFATDLGVGPGSYTTVNGERAEFRNYDTDNGGRRASYTMPGPSSRLGPVGTEITCVLHSSDGTALGWFKTGAPGGEGAGMISGPLPQ
jgi:hypothetical protein